ncbi:MAG: pirin family protein [Desulfopila sp.]
MKDDYATGRMAKKVSGIYGRTASHWVGDGFLVQSLLNYNDPRRSCDPFLLLDYAAPYRFDPNSGAPRGVGQHPHKGFETVTIAYQGEVAHRDSSGGGGVIREGDVQWMTAGSGIVHEEFHSKTFSRQGGMFEMVQLWVNLPAARKGTAAAYQAIAAEEIPVVELPDAAGSVRVIAGSYGDRMGAAVTFTAINVWDVRLAAEAAVTLALPASHNLVVVVLDGEVSFTGEHRATTGELVTFARGGSSLTMKTAGRGAKVLLLSGEPLGEPVVGYGPFVMNSAEEIHQAFKEYEEGTFGVIDE